MCNTARLPMDILYERLLERQIVPFRESTTDRRYAAFAYILRSYMDPFQMLTEERILKIAEDVHEGITTEIH